MLLVDNQGYRFISGQNIEFHFDLRTGLCILATVKTRNLH